MDDLVAEVLPTNFISDLRIEHCRLHSIENLKRANSARLVERCMFTPDENKQHHHAGNDRKKAMIPS